ncbi:MAG TPA: FkbM family methyltransferase [Gammaproteobacteria bacterium]|nr:FkbM family methyltransferase [Gammaproteobacteria bacterium]
MKLREFLYGLGVKPRTREFAFDIQRFELSREGEIEFAVWRHPAEKPKEFTQAEVDALREFLSPGDYAIDIGAHTGDSALPIALAVGPDGGVLAFEPNPYVFKILQANANLNKGKINISPFMFAATMEDREFEFEYSDSGFCNGGLHPGVSAWRHAHFFKLTVQGRNLEGLIERECPQTSSRIRYIKIDTEGYDPEVVRSIHGLIERNRPYIKTEIYKHLSSDRRKSYFRELSGLGYRLYKWENNCTYRGRAVSEKNADDWKHYDIFAVPE